MSKICNMMVVATLVFGICAALPANASTAEEQLASTAPIMKGHIVALCFSDYISTLGPKMEWDKPVLVAFNEKELHLAFVIFSDRDRRETIDEAKKEMDRFRNLLVDILSMVNPSFGLSLHENDLAISYLNENVNLGIQFKDGAYVIE